MHTAFLFFSHGSSFFRLEVIISDQMKKAMDDVKGRLLIGIKPLFFGVGNSCFRTNENFPQVAVVEGKRNAVGWSRVVEKLAMKGNDLFF